MIVMSVGCLSPFQGIGRYLHLSQLVICEFLPTQKERLNYPGDRFLPTRSS